MVLWSRLRQSRFRLHAFSNEFKRFYNLNPAPIIANQHISSRKLVPVLNYPKLIVQDEQLALFQQVRFYAKPLKKAAERDDSEPRMNEEIMAPTVRLVIDGENHCIVSRHEALARAKSLKLDLVEVDKNGKPPVCKILDYNKQKYLQQTKEKERAKSKSTLRPGAAKEIRFGGKIKLNDLKIKADMVKRLMEKGYRVKCTAVDGAEGDFKKLLSQFTALIDDVAVVESEPKCEKKQAFVIVRHIKFGPTNKPGKKASVTAESSQTTEDSDEDAQTDNAQTTKSEWAGFGGDDDRAHSMFEIGSEENGHLENSKQETPYSVDRNVRHEVEPAPTRTNSSVPSGIPKPATDPRPAYPPRMPVGLSSVPNQGNQPRAGMNTSPKMRPGQQVQVPARGIPKQGSSDSSDQNTPDKSYGIFSMPKANTVHQGQNTPATTDRYRQNVPPDSARNPRTTGASPQRESPAADSSPGQGGYGIFSAVQNENEASSGQQVQVPARGIPKPGSSDSSDQNTPAKSYGIFSMPKANTVHQGQNTPATTDRYRQNVPPDSARNPRTTGASPQRESPAADSSPGQGGYGIFSAVKNENQAQKR